MNGQKGVAILIVAMLLTVGIGYFANVTETDVTRTTYNKITDLEGIIRENAGDVSSYSEYSPTSNVTGWYGNSTIPLTENGAVSPYVINPRGVAYTPSTYTVNMRSFTHTTGDITYASNSISTSEWATSTSGVTYASYPIVGEPGADSQNAWTKYSDGSTIHGGVTTSKAHSSIGWGYYSQTDKIRYFVGDTAYSSGYLIFATVEDILLKAGVTLGNNYRVSFTGNVLYGCNLYVDKYYSGVEYDDSSALRKITTNTDVHLQGYESTASTITHLNGEYTGYDENGNAIWTSNNVYVYTTKSTISVTVSVPSITNPTYADPYQMTVIGNSPYSLDPVTNTFTYDWTNHPLTESSIIQSEAYTIDKDIGLYITSTALIPDTYGDLSATLSDGTTVASLDDSFLELYDGGVWGYKSSPTYNYTWDGHSKTVYEVAYYMTSQVSTGYVYYMYSSELIPKFVPNPVEGDIVTFNLESGVTNATMIVPNTDYAITNNGYGALVFYKQYWTTLGVGATSLASFESGNNAVQSANRIPLTGVYFKYTDGMWKPYNLANNNAYGYNTNEDYAETSTTAGTRTYTVMPGNLIIIQSQESSGTPTMNITMNYIRSTFQFETTDPDVVFGDFTDLTLSDGSALHGGETTGWINLDSPIDGIEQVKLTYNLSGERANLRWIGLRDLIRECGNDILMTATRISISGQALTSLYQNLSVTVNVTNPTATQQQYAIVLQGSPLVCDYMEYDTSGVWLAYTGDTVVWTGQLADLTLVTDSTSDFEIVVDTEGYAWGMNPTDDTNVAFWSNGADNATIVNGKVSFIIRPVSSVETDLYIFTGDNLIVTAIPQGSGYNFVYTIGSSAPVNVGNYQGLYITYSVVDDTLVVRGLTSLTNAVAYSISPITYTEDLISTDSLRFIYFLAINSDWGAYITQTEVQNDPLGMLWGGFDVNLNNYLSSYIPGLRVAINGVVAYGDSITINGVEMPVENGQITYNGKHYNLKGSAIDYSTDNKTYLIISDGAKATLDLGNTQSYNIVGEGSWYFATSAYAISDISSKEYQWNPNWELDWNGCIIVFIVSIVLLTIVIARIELFGGLEWMDVAVLAGAIIICFSLVGGIEQ